MCAGAGAGNRGTVRRSDRGGYAGDWTSHTTKRWWRASVAHVQARTCASGWSGATESGAACSRSARPSCSRERRSRRPSRESTRWWTGSRLRDANRGVLVASDRVAGRFGDRLLRRRRDRQSGGAQAVFGFVGAAGGLMALVAARRSRTLNEVARRPDRASTSVMGEGSVGTPPSVSVVGGIGRERWISRSDRISTGNRGESPRSDSVTRRR